MTKPTGKPVGRPALSDVDKLKAPWYRPFDDVTKKGRKIYWTPKRIDRFGTYMVTWFKEHGDAVSLGAFCWDNKIPKEYLSKFGKKSQYFGYCLSTVKSLLETRLLSLGLAGEIDKVMAIFSLKNVAGWRDKKEINNNIEVTSKVVELQLPKKRAPIEVKAEVIEAKKLGKPKPATND